MSGCPATRAATTGPHAPWQTRLDSQIVQYTCCRLTPFINCCYNKICTAHHIPAGKNFSVIRLVGQGLAFTDDHTATFISMDAELGKSLLESEGIEGFIRNLYANALYPGLLGQVELQVRKEDVKKALEVLGS